MQSIMGVLGRQTVGWTVFLAGLLLASVLLTGCGAAAPSTEAAPPLDEAALREIVQDAVQQSPPADAATAAATPEELQKMVEEAVMTAASRQEAVTSEDLERAVQAAVEQASQDAVTRAELDEAINRALKDASPGELVIYSGRSKTLVDPVIQQFKDATGIDVKVKYAGTSQLAATILEEGEKSPADVFFAQDPGGLGAVEEMFVQLPPGILGQVPDWARSPEGKWVGLSGRARALVYNHEILSEQELPDDIYGLTDPKWKGRLGWAPTNASFQTMVTAMRTAWGEEKTRLWLEGIMANEPRVYPKNTPQVAAAAAGEIDVGMVNHYYLFRFLAEEGEDFPARNYHPRAGGPGATIMVAGAGILQSAENRVSAERFLEFMLSKVGQQYFAGQTYEYPLVEGIKTPRVLVPLADINHPTIPLKDLADLDGTLALLRETGVVP